MSSDYSENQNGAPLWTIGKIDKRMIIIKKERERFLKQIERNLGELDIKR